MPSGSFERGHNHIQIPHKMLLIEAAYDQGHVVIRCRKFKHNREKENCNNYPQTLFVIIKTQNATTATTSTSTNNKHINVYSCGILLKCITAISASQVFSVVSATTTVVITINV